MLLLFSYEEITCKLYECKDTGNICHECVAKMGDEMEYINAVQMKIDAKFTISCYRN